VTVELPEEERPVASDGRAPARAQRLEGAVGRTRGILYLLGGAVGLSVVSRLVGVIREAAIVGLLGVHDFTDAYFATSSVVAWLQTWAFGALTLYLVPTYVGASPARRSDLYRRHLRIGAGLAAPAAALFVVCYGPLEEALLGGRRVLGAVEAILLGGGIFAACLGGVAYGRLLAEERGVLVGARALFLGNLAGVLTLFLMLLLPGSQQAVLPATLCVSQVAIAVLCAKAAAVLPEVDHGGGDVRRRPHFLATTLENVGFNLSTVVQQGMAGALAPGAVTWNAYAVRFTLLPLSGIMAPLQQMLLRRFSVAGEASGRLLAVRVVRTAVLAGLVVGGVLSVSLRASYPYWSAGTEAAMRSHSLPLTVFCYSAYAGVMFANQASARWFFANGTGWPYTAAMLAAYFAGTALRVPLVSALGLPGLPLGALAAEGTVSVIFALYIGRSRLSVEAP
jgi:peptidoglycan biosynthesis protein MviN/MurJ (putative lipid II flippase)